MVKNNRKVEIALDYTHLMGGVPVFHILLRISIELIGLATEQTGSIYL